MTSVLTKASSMDGYHVQGNRYVRAVRTVPLVDCRPSRELPANEQGRYSHPCQQRQGGVTQARQARDVHPRLVAGRVHAQPTQRRKDAGDASGSYLVDMKEIVRALKIWALVAFFTALALFCAHMEYVDVCMGVVTG